MQNITEANDYSFDAEVLTCDVPVFTRFWANWSTPSSKIAEDLQHIATSYGEHVKVVHVDIDSNPLTTSKYSVLQIPTVILFRNGIPVERMDGNISSKQLQSKANQHIQTA
ncbi:thioredoxin domain-containing protein [Anaerolineales bacterium HSG6]|nr:thioredoxin domain-containing protein [Anaerolineales bacterium HSG6]MDM8531526.1 thioredoxin domain-containing protein [Anaerolineales bacterium HSG25]